MHCIICYIFFALQKIKLQDEVRFGESLDLYRYTTIGLCELDVNGAIAPVLSVTDDASTPVSNAPSPGPRRGEFTYELRGVLVHSGNARGGHYMSYIKPREGMRGVEATRRGRRHKSLLPFRPFP